MAYIEWDAGYSVNFAEIDGHHQRLFDLINELHEAREHGGQDRAGSVLNERECVADVVQELRDLTSVLDELLDYASYHFSTEERLMVQHGYPAYGPHRKAHQAFLQKVQLFRRDFDEGQPVSCSAVTRFLADWLIHHIKDTDKLLGAFLNGRNPRRRLSDGSSLVFSLGLY